MEVTFALRIGNSRRAYHRRTADTEQTRSCGEAMDETSGKIGYGTKGCRANSKVIVSCKQRLNNGYFIANHLVYKIN